MSTLMTLLLRVLAVIGSLYSAVAQTNIQDSIQHQGRSRLFIVHLPPNYAVTTKRPLIINLHGGSGTMMNAQGFTQMNPVADRNDFIVAWPQGYGIASPGYSWADGRNTSADQQGVDDVGFIDNLIDTLIATYNVDAGRIYVCGFSNGGFMVQRLACELAHRFAAMASLGSSMDTVLRRSCSSLIPVPMAFFNGTSDPLMPYEGGLMQNPQVLPVLPVDTVVHHWVQRNACLDTLAVHRFPDVNTADSSTVDLYRYTNCSCNADVSFYRVNNGGHTWPGVYVPAQERVLGRTNRDILASEELWSFFSRYVRCGSTSSIDESTSVLPEVYPNPFRERLVDRGRNGSESYRLISAEGSTVYDGPDIAHADLSRLPVGVYILSIVRTTSVASTIVCKQD